MPVARSEQIAELTAARPGAVPVRDLDGDVLAADDFALVMFDYAADE